MHRERERPKGRERKENCWNATDKMEKEKTKLKSEWENNEKHIHSSEEKKEKNEENEEKKKQKNLIKFFIRNKQT